MIAISLLLMLVLTLWLMAAVIGVVFKLTFALIGGLFSIVGAALGLLFGGVALLVIAPLVALAVLPFCLPVILLVAVVWAIARAMHRPVSPAPMTAR